MSNYQEYTVRVYPDRTEWYVDRQYHRVDGPAIEYANGDKAWYLNGQLHRVDGPAIEYANGNKYWLLNGKCLTEAEHKKQTAKSPSCDGETVEIRGKKYRLTAV